MNRPLRNVDKEVEATLELAEQILPVEPNPLLKERIMARLEAAEPVSPKPSWLRKNKFAIAAAMILLAANTVTLVQYVSGNAGTSSSDVELEAIAETYNFSSDYTY